MKRGKNVLKILAITAALTVICTGTVLGYESDFADGIYRYVNTRYTTSKSGSNELVCKIDKYYYENNSDVMFCAADDYFYKRNSSGKVINTNCYGYAVARFENGSSVAASSGRKYGYGNRVAWSDGCGNWKYKPHYYGTTIR